MSPEFEAAFRREVRFRIIEKRTKELEAFLREHLLDQPKSVPYVPLAGCELKRCFVNVERQVQRMGGTMETGWLFCECEHINIHTEAHAIWITPQGRRTDITPHRFPPKRILFTVDPRVSQKRGFTVGHKTILSRDPVVCAIERFDVELDRLYEEFFVDFGCYSTIPNNRLREAATHANLPWDVAEYMIRQKQKYYQDSSARFLA